MSFHLRPLFALLCLGSLTLGTGGCTDLDHEDDADPAEDTSLVAEGAQALSSACADASSDRFTNLIADLDNALVRANKNRDKTRARNLKLGIALDTHPDGTGGTYGYANELYSSIAAARDELAQYQADVFVTPAHQLTPIEGYNLNWGFDTIVRDLSHAAISASVNAYQNDTANGSTSARDAGDEVLTAMNELNDLRAKTYRCWTDAYVP
jgi:hypothetical protein